MKKKFIIYRVIASFIMSKGESVWILLREQRTMSKHLHKRKYKVVMKFGQIAMDLYLEK